MDRLTAGERVRALLCGMSARRAATKGLRRGSCERTCLRAHSVRKIPRNMRRVSRGPGGFFSGRFSGSLLGGSALVGHAAAVSAP